MLKSPQAAEQAAINCRLQAYPGTSGQSSEVLESGVWGAEGFAVWFQ